MLGLLAALALPVAVGAAVKRRPPRRRRASHQVPAEGMDEHATARAIEDGWALGDGASEPRALGVSDPICHADELRALAEIEETPEQERARRERGR